MGVVSGLATLGPIHNLGICGIDRPLRHWGNVWQLPPQHKCSHHYEYHHDSSCKYVDDHRGPINYDLDRTSSYHCTPIYYDASHDTGNANIGLSAGDGAVGNTTAGNLTVGVTHRSSRFLLRSSGGHRRHFSRNADGL